MLVSSIRIQKNDLELFQEIGSGSFGRIHRAKWLINDNIVAVKVLHPIHLNNETRQIFFNELSVLNILRHPNIVTFYGACLNEDWLAIVMEYISLGSLYRLLHLEKVELSWSDRLSIALQIIKGINYLHKHQPQILHRDIKSSNLLLENRYEGYFVKICDFGMAKTRDETTKELPSRMLTVAWAAPELWCGQSHTTQTDIYSLGIVYFEIATYQVPYAGWEEFAIRQSVLDGDRLELPDTVPDDFHSIIQKCWTHTPNDRPTCTDLIDILTKCDPKQSKSYNIFEQINI